MLHLLDARVVRPHVLWLYLRPAIVVAAILVGTARPCIGQDPPPAPRSTWVDSSVPRLMARWGTNIPRGIVIDILRQSFGPQPAAKRDELADSIVAQAIRTKNANFEITTITLAGQPAEKDRVGTPDPRALDWLIRIHREAQDYETRMIALVNMRTQVNKARAQSYLLEVATRRDDETAWIAVMDLIAWATIDNGSSTPAEREQVLLQLRRLWDQGLVGDRKGKTLLERVAGFRRWPAPPPGKGEA